MNRTEVTVSTRTLVRILAVLGLAWVLYEVRGVLVWVFIALFLALALNAPVVALERRGLKRTPAAVVVFLLTVAVVIVFAVALAKPLYDEIREFIDGLPQIVADLRSSDLLRDLDRRFDLFDRLEQGAEDVAGKAPDTLLGLLGLGGKVFGAGLAVFTVAFMTLFLLMELPAATRAAHSMLDPHASDRIAALQARIGSTVSRYAIGAITIATIAGTTIGTASWIVGAPYPFTLGLAVGLLGLIPQIGAAMGGLVVVAVTLTQGIAPALVMIAVVVVYQQVENYVLQPAIQGRAVEVSPFIVLASVVTGVALLGVVGALVAVPVAASLQIILLEATEARRTRMAALRLEQAVDRQESPRDPGEAWSGVEPPTPLEEAVDDVLDAVEDAADGKR